MPHPDPVSPERSKAEALAKHIGDCVQAVAEGVTTAEVEREAARVIEIALNEREPAMTCAFCFAVVCGRTDDDWRQKATAHVLACRQHPLFSELDRMRKALEEIVREHENIKRDYKLDPGAMLSAEVAGWRGAAIVASAALNPSDGAPAT